MHDRPHQPEAPRDDRQPSGARAPERAFAVDRVGAERNRSPIRPFLAVGVLLVAIASLAWIGRPPAGDPSRTAGSVGPASTPPAAETAEQRPVRDLVVLISPSRDGVPVTGSTLRVVGYGPRSLRTVAIALDDGTGLRDIAVTGAAPRAGDPAADRRSWFRATVPLAPPAGTLLLEVRVFGPTGEPVATITRSLTRLAAPPRNPADSPILGGNLPDREHGTDGLLGGLVFPPDD